MSMTTREIDTPQLCATQLVARPGTLPSITIPMTPSFVPDVDGIWRYLAEPAEFFGVRMPPLGDLATAISVFATASADGTRPALVAASVTITEADDAPRILVTGTAVQPSTSEAVLIGGALAAPALHRATDPWWRRMAARTTSRAEVDQCERWLNGLGFADGLADGLPILGALVFEAEGDVLGVDNPEPTSVLDQLVQCGALAGIDRVAECRAGAERVWWVSPRYQTHPVAELDGVQFTVDPPAVPPFARWS